MSTKLRQEIHRLGYKALTLGKYAESAVILESCIQLHGPHVGPLADLAFAHYLSGDMGRFRLSVERLEMEYQTARALLSVESQIKTQIALAKNFEELGRLNDAITNIDSTIKLLPPGHQLDFQVRCQKLRLLASFGREDETAALYRACLAVSESTPQILLECYHALIIAEARLFGILAAWPRLENFLARNSLQAADMRLVLMDLLEIALERADRGSVDRVLKVIDSEKLENTSDMFEKNLIRLAQNSEWAPGPQDYFEWSRGISPMGQIRLLALAARSSRDARERLANFLNSFDHLTRRNLLHKWGSALRTVDLIEVTLDQEQKELRYKDQILSLKKSPFAWDLVVTLSHLAGERSPDQMLNALGKPATPHNCEGLRINLTRLNKRLCTLLGVDWVVRYGKQKISLRPHLRLS